ncbi:unnamed protein product [Lymnaea stagnalis]|uniref:Hexosyltransferase n=1 Tax=Lymnaea stagnalis TaxID=6523 RepID=A0AAV2HDV5_LYMST
MFGRNIRRMNSRRAFDVMFVALVLTTLSYLSVEIHYIKYRRYEPVGLQEHIPIGDSLVSMSPEVTTRSLSTDVDRKKSIFRTSGGSDIFSAMTISNETDSTVTKTISETGIAKPSSTPLGLNSSITSDAPQSKSGYFFYSTEDLFKNLTKPSGGTTLFTYIPEDEYLKSNWNNYTSSPAVKTYFNYPLLITGEDICLRDVPFLLIFIPSVVDNRERRDAIRRTWLRAAETNSWPQAHVRKKIKHIFLFGLKVDRKKEDLQILKNESILYNDIVVADFEDSYRNLTIKILVGLKWVLKFCNMAEFALKVDQDTFINVPLMVEYLLHVRWKLVTDNFVVGLRHGYDKPEVVRSGNWGVAEEEYPLPFYPRYLYGHTYAVSRGGVGVIVSAAERVRLIAPEDAFITGILTKLSGVPRLDAPCFTMCCRKIYACEVVWNRNVAVTAVDSVTLMEQLWGSVVTHTCNDTKPFN